MGLPNILIRSCSLVISIGSLIGPILKGTAKDIDATDVTGDNRIVKISVVGVGMRSHAGVASTIFKALADEKINIQMISTSEIKVSVVVDEKYLKPAVRVLHMVFDLGTE